MIYRLFISIMDFLTFHFGYHKALRIKDIFDNLDWAIVIGSVLIWAFVYFALHTFRSNTVENEVAIQKVETKDGTIRMQFNPKQAWDVIESFLGFYFLLISPKQSIRFKTLRPIRKIVLVILIILLIMGILLSSWDYFPDGLNVPSELLKNGH